MGGEIGMVDYVVGGAVLVLLIWGVVLYNQLVARRHHANAAWSDIDVQLKRRHDLLPKLAEVAKAYAGHEQRVQEGVTALRSASVSSPADLESKVTGALRQLFAVAEAYPELKASANFLALQGEVSQVEEQIQYARRYFNGSVRELNILVQSFPSNLVAAGLGFSLMDYFDIELATQRESPALDLGQRK
jgi:LemA protein